MLLSSEKRELVCHFCNEEFFIRRAFPAWNTFYFVISTNGLHKSGNCSHLKSTVALWSLACLLRRAGQPAASPSQQLLPERPLTKPHRIGTTSRTWPPLAVRRVGGTYRRPGAITFRSYPHPTQWTQSEGIVHKADTNRDQCLPPSIVDDIALSTTWEEMQQCSA